MQYDLSEYIVLLVGKSGSGKSTVAQKLELLYGWEQLQSYTTRLPRFEGEFGHTFVTDEEFDKLENLCAYTEFNGYRYCATSDQVDQVMVYVIDPAGVDYFHKHYTGKKIPVVVYLNVSEEECYRRMKMRGDSEEYARSRVEHDREAFFNASRQADLIIKSDMKTPFECAQKIMSHLEARKAIADKYTSEKWTDITSTNEEAFEREYYSIWGDPLDRQ